MAVWSGSIAVFEDDLRTKETVTLTFICGVRGTRQFGFTLCFRSRLGVQADECELRGDKLLGRVRWMPMLRFTRRQAIRFPSRGASHGRVAPVICCALTGSTDGVSQTFKATPTNIQMQTTKETTCCMKLKGANQKVCDTPGGTKLVGSIIHPDLGSTDITMAIS